MRTSQVIVLMVPRAGVEPATYRLGGGTTNTINDVDSKRIYCSCRPINREQETLEFIGKYSVLGFDIVRTLQQLPVSVQP